MKYGSFFIEDNNAHWNRDDSIQIAMEPSDSPDCLLEGIWSPDNKALETKYKTAIAGVCMWNKYDCLFTFMAKNRSNPGAKRSLGGTKDRVDLFKRLKAGEQLDTITMSSDPLGSYQRKTISWQMHIAQRFGIEKIYYVIPFEEYKRMLDGLEPFLSSEAMNTMYATLEDHHQKLKTYIKDQTTAEVEFIYPLRQSSVTSVAESYTWPYKNLKVDMGIEEMQEFRIPYEVREANIDIPPILLGALDSRCPYFEKRDNNNDIITLQLRK